MNVHDVVETELTLDNGVWVGPQGNYWSNLNIEENERYLREVSTLGARETVRRYFPEHHDIIFSPKRAGGLLFLDPQPGEIVVDAGCMWGALTVPLARSGCSVIGIDQTRESLALLQQRLLEDRLEDVELVCADLNRIAFRPSSVDAFVVNGVLEWIPAFDSIELKKYYGKRVPSAKAAPKASPYELQLGFLKKICTALKEGGRLYLAIENRYDVFYLTGLPDPHCDLPFITFLPRFLQDAISKMILGRPYVNWIYSRRALTKMLHEAGFASVECHYAFPDYHFPEFILTADGMDLFRPFKYATARNTVKKIGCYAVEKVVFQWLRLHELAPSFIVIARKGTDGTRT